METIDKILEIFFYLPLTAVGTFPLLVLGAIIVFSALAVVGTVVLAAQRTLTSELLIVFPVWPGMALAAWHLAWSLVGLYQDADPSFSVNFIIVGAGVWVAMFLCSFLFEK